MVLRAAVIPLCLAWPWVADRRRDYQV